MLVVMVSGCIALHCIALQGKAWRSMALHASSSLVPVVHVTGLRSEVAAVQMQIMSQSQDYVCRGRALLSRQYLESH